MERFMNIVKSNIVLQAVLCIVLGLFLLINPRITVEGVIGLFGVLFLLTGVASLVSFGREKSAKYHDQGVLMAGIFFCIVAAVALFFPVVIAKFFSVVLGLIIVLCGVVNVVRSVNLRKYGDALWYGSLAFSLLIVLGGLAIVVNPFPSVMTFVMVLGVALIVNGATDLLLEWRTSRGEKAAA